MANPYRDLLAIIPKAPLLVGEVVSVSGASAVVELPDGGRLTVRGDAAVGDPVFVRDGAIEAPAPSLTAIDIEV